MFGYGATSTTSTSASASPFGGSSLFGSSSPPTDPICLLFRSSSFTAPTSNSFGSCFSTCLSTAPPNLFGFRSSAPPNLFGSATGAKPTSSLFESSPSPSQFGTGALFGSSSSGNSNLFGSGPPTLSSFGVSSAAPASSTSSHPFGAASSGSPPVSNLFGSGPPTLSSFSVSSAAPASSTSSHLFGAASSGSPPVSSSSSAVSTAFVASTSAPSSASSAPQAQSAAACSEACSSEGALKHEAAFAEKHQSPKVVCQSSGYSPEVLAKNELHHPAHGGIMSVDVQMNSSLQNTLFPAKTHLIEQILRKHGDITKGSILRSTEAKTYFLQLVAEVVERLQSHTLGTISAHDIVTMRKWTNDAVAVGFNVEWLQQRIKKVAAISKFQDNSTHLTEISEKVEAARIALWEMELQEMIVKKEMDFVKADMGTESFCRSNLCEGLF